MPSLFVIGLFLYYLGAYVANVHLLHTVSEGGFLTVLWLLQNVKDMPIADAKNPYPAPGQAYFDRDKDGAFIPGDIGARKAGK